SGVLPPGSAAVGTSRSCSYVQNGGCGVQTMLKCPARGVQKVLKRAVGSTPQARGAEGSRGPVADYCKALLVVAVTLAVVGVLQAIISPLPTAILLYLIP